MPVETELVAIENPDALNVILGQTHFIKTAEDVHEALVGSVPGIKFGVAFCEASGPALVRVEGNDESLKKLAAKNALAVGAGHFFVVFMKEAYPINVLRALREVPEIVTVFAATGRNFRDFGCPQPNPKSGHPDGWGIACVGQEGEFYARGPGSATADPKYEDTVRRLSRVCSPPLILVAHLRYASKKDTIQERYSRTCVPYYTLHETATEDARFVCSEVLPTLPGRWRMLRNGEFVELRP